MTLSHTVELGDKEIIKIIEEYLANKQVDIALICLERESRESLMVCPEYGSGWKGYLVVINHV